MMSRNKQKVGFHASMAILKTNSTGSRWAGDIYIGTMNGLFLKKSNSFEIVKIPGINEEIKATYIDFNGGAFAVTALGNLFYISVDGENDQGIQSYVPEPVLTIGILQKDSVGTRKAGDLYLGTSNGLYLKYVGTHSVQRIPEIDGPIAGIHIDFNGGAFVFTLEGKLYYVGIDGENDQGVQSYIPGYVQSLGVCKEQYAGSILKPGDLYIGTTKGLFLKHVYTHNIDLIDDIDVVIIDIHMDYNNGAYLISEEGILYYINNVGISEGVQDYIPGKVFSIGILQKQSQGSRKAGDIYIGTNDGVYLKYVGTKQLLRIPGIYGPIHSITIDHIGGAYVITSRNFCYYIDINGEPSGFQANLLKIGALQ